MKQVWPPSELIQIKLEAIRNDPALLMRHTIEIQATCFRFASLDYSNSIQFTDGQGARINGGRFNPRSGGPATLYLALDLETAAAEVGSWYDYYNLPISTFMPRIVAAVAVCASHVLNLTSPRVRKSLQISKRHLAEDWRASNDSGKIAPTQAFGQLVYQAGFEGMFVASLRKTKGRNLVLFPENYLGNSQAIMLPQNH